MILDNNDLLQSLRSDFTDVTFKPADSFAWQAETHTVQFNPTDENWQQLLLHELGHASLNHTDYRSDIELLRFEAEAWEYAKQHLSLKYKVDLDDQLIESHKDSYRDWLHRRSRCPKCECGGWQTGRDQYKCPNCLSEWAVNSDKFKRVHRKLHKK
ncbi:MAG: hypothetical protein LBH36_01765 [Candidatus Nomurabacteria bacterium]|jgi:hypothetical protein|nr:hypothetical protein [Candidatus Nomurabacteria bacterium]